MEKTEAIYNLKKSIKALGSSTLNRNKVVNTLNEVRRYLYTLKRHDAMKAVEEAANSILHNEYELKDTTAKINYAISDLKRAQEKTAVMRQRECWAEMVYNNKERRQKKNNYGCSEVSSIEKYDVILAPTLGGMHYCVVADIQDSQVIVYPMTTASKEDLHMIGHRSYSLHEIEGPHKCTRLTSCKTILSYEDACRSFVDKIPYSKKIEKAINYVSR